MQWGKRRKNGVGTERIISSYECDIYNKHMYILHHYNNEILRCIKNVCLLYIMCTAFDSHLHIFLNFVTQN